MAAEPESPRSSLLAWEASVDASTSSVSQSSSSSSIRSAQQTLPPSAGRRPVGTGEAFGERCGTQGEEAIDKRGESEYQELQSEHDSTGALAASSRAQAGRPSDMNGVGRGRLSSR